MFLSIHRLHRILLAITQAFKTNSLGLIPKYQILVSIVLVLNCKVNAQEIIKIDSTTNHQLEIFSNKQSNDYIVIESKHNKIIKKAKLKILKERNDESNNHFFEHFQNIENISPYKIKNIHSAFNGQLNLACMTDTLFTYNILGKVSSMCIFRENNAIECFQYIGERLGNHSIQINRHTYDTAFSFNGYEALIRNAKKEIIQYTQYKNGTFETIVKDNELNFKDVRYINLKSGEFYKYDEAKKEFQKTGLTTLGNNRFSLNEAYTNNPKNAIKKMVLFEKARGKSVEFSKLYDRKSACKVIQRELYKNNLLSKRIQYDTGGSIRELYINEQAHASMDSRFKNLNQPLNIQIHTEQNLLTYKGEQYHGHLVKKDDQWLGIDSFMVNGNIYVTKIKQQSDYFEFTRYLNGKFIMSGSRSSKAEEINRLREERHDPFIINNDYINTIVHNFHNDQVEIKLGDSMVIGKDSSISYKRNGNRLQLSFTKANKTEIVLSKTSSELLLYKDQKLCAMGAKDESGKTIIPAKFDEIQEIELFDNFTVYLCMVNNLTTILSNEGKSIIHLRNGFISKPHKTTENYRKKHQMLLPYVLTCNNLNKDSFSLISISDRVIQSGKGMYEFQKDKTILISTESNNQLYTENGECLCDSAINIKAYYNGFYVCTFNKQRNSKDALKRGDSSRTKNNNLDEYTHQFIDLNKGSYNGLYFDKIKYYEYYSLTLKKTGMTMMVFPNSEIKIDTADLNFEELKHDDYVLIKHYNKIGAIKRHSNKYFSPIYDEIKISNLDAVARNGKTLDVFDLYNTKKFSLTLKENPEPDETGLKIDPWNSASIDDPKSNNMFFKIKIEDQFGLYDENGKTLLKPEFDDIILEFANSQESSFFYENTLPHKTKWVAKTIKNKLAEIYCFTGDSMVLIRPLMLWSIKKDILVKPNGELIEGNYKFKIDYQNNKVELYNPENMSLMKIYDISGTERLNNENYLQVKQMINVNYFQLKNLKCGVMDHNFKPLIEAEFSNIYFNKAQNLLWFKYGYKNELWKLKFMNSNTLAEDSFDHVFIIEPSSKLFAYIKNNKYGLMDQSGKVILKPTYNNVCFDQADKNYLLSRNNQYYAWSSKTHSIIPQAYKNLFYVHHRSYDPKRAETYFAFRKYNMYLISNDFIAYDSSADMFFDKKLNSSENVIVDFSKHTFILEKKNNLRHLNSLLKATSQTHWLQLHFIQSFPKEEILPNKNRDTVYQSSSDINKNIKYSYYTKLNYYHFKSREMREIADGRTTISFSNNKNDYFLNVGVDSLLGYMVFDLADVFKNEGEIKLTEKIMKIWTSMDDPTLPCLSKELIFKHFKTKFSVKKDEFRFYIDTYHSFSIPISELKPFMTEFWQKRF